MLKTCFASVPLVLLAFVLMPISVGADLSPLAPLFSFETSFVHNLTTNGEGVDFTLMSYHGSSQNWVLFMRHDELDLVPYDNLIVSVACNGASAYVFNTTVMSQWVDEGMLSIEYPYQGNMSIRYNSVSHTARYSRCTVGISDYGNDSYAGNVENYTFVRLEAIPFLSVLEFVDCTPYDTAELGLLGNISSLVAMMTDFWQMLWLVVSITAIIFGIFMVPIFVFIIIRWFIFRVTGTKIIERGAGS